MSRTVPFVVSIVLLVGGCAPAFVPEKFDVGPNSLQVKGWTVTGRQLAVDFELTPHGRTISLYSVALVAPDGRRLYPSRLDDRTPKPVRINLGFGMGLGGQGGGGVDPETEGHGPGGGVTTGLGAGVPIVLGTESRGVTRCTMYWPLAHPFMSVNECTLRVVLAMMVLRTSQLLTMPLAMSQPPVQPTSDGKAPENREVDFSVRAASPGGLAWMGFPAPPGVAGVRIACGTGSVAVVLPGGIRTGQTVSGTIVPLPAGPWGPALPTGLQLQDPNGNKHPVEPGRAVTFRPDKPMMTWKVLRNGEVLGTRNVGVKSLSGPADMQGARTPIVQENCAFTVPGTFDGNAGNTTIRVGDRPATILAESATSAIAVVTDLGQTAGKVPIQVTDAGKTTTLDGPAVTVRADCPALSKGQTGTAKVTVAGLSGVGPIGLSVATCNPRTVKMADGTKTHRSRVDPSRIDAHGVFHLDVPVVAIQSGPYVFAAAAGTGTGKSQCKRLDCFNCDSTWRGTCDDTGKVLCSGTRGCTCGGGASHRATGCGGACDHWLCACPFNSCACR